MSEKILLVDDEPSLRETLAYNLRNAGYMVTTAADGSTALEQARAEPPDLVLLDLMLPEIDGLTVCRSLRQLSDVPILILTARTGELDKIVGLESGADDYLTKPFSLGELQARIRALLRRAGTARHADEISSGNLRLNLVSRRAFLDDQELVLSPKEFSLLAELMRHQGAVLSRDLLLTRVWGYDFYGDGRTVDVHVRWLREKIEQEPAHPARLVTVRGIGYRFEG
jgi:DNA-binding response OmpR family regulator